VVQISASYSANALVNIHGDPPLPETIGISRGHLSQASKKLVFADNLLSLRSPYLDTLITHYSRCPKDYFRGHRPETAAAEQGACRMPSHCDAFVPGLSGFDGGGGVRDFIGVMVEYLLLRGGGGGEGGGEGAGMVGLKDVVGGVEKEVSRFHEF